MPLCPSAEPVAFTERILLLALALSVLGAGCIIVVPAQDDSEATFMPTLMTAQFLNPPSWAYADVPLMLHARVMNQGPASAAAAPVCIAVDGVTLNVTQDPATQCPLVALVQGESRDVDYFLKPLIVGPHAISVLDASINVLGRVTPVIGNRINGTVIDLQLEGVNGNWTVRAFPRGAPQSLEVRLRWGANERAFNFLGVEDVFQFQTTARSLDLPVGLNAKATVRNPVTGVELEQNLFVWRRA